MEPKLANYLQFKKLLSESSGLKQLSKIQQLVVLVYAVSSFHELQCQNQEDEKCEFPLNWNQNNQGVYRIKYVLPKTSKYQGKVVQFRLVDNGDGISANFVVENTEMLYCAELLSSKTDEENIKALEGELLKILQSKQYQNRPENERGFRPLLEPVPLEPVPLNPDPFNPGPGERPMPMDVGPGTIPIGMPFNREEYVGPNSGFFGRQGPQRPGFVPGVNRPPPGSRWDPIDPFGLEEDPNSRNGGEFSGFNPMGQPRGENPFSGNFGPNGSRFF